MNCDIEPYWQPGSSSLHRDWVFKGGLNCSREARRIPVVMQVFYYQILAFLRRFVCLYIARASKACGLSEARIAKVCLRTIPKKNLKTGEVLLKLSFQEN